MKAQWLGRVLLRAGLLCLVTGTVAAQQYTMVHLGFSGSGSLPLYGFNNQGDIVGHYDQTNTPFRYTAGVLTFFGATNTGAVAINNSGQIVIDTPTDHSAITGTYSIPTQPPTLVPYYVDLGSLYSGGHSRAYAINDSGTVVGFSADAASTVSHAFIYSFSSNHMTDLGTLGTTSMARAINNSGQIVGESLTTAGYRRAFQMVNGTMTDMDPANPTYDSYATAINDAGQIVVVTNKAWCRVFGPSRMARPSQVACRGSYWYTLLYNGGTATNLGNLGAALGTFGASMNLGGDVVGMTNIAGPHQHAFLYHAGSMTDLNNYVTAGWTLQLANNINDWGQIVCLGRSPTGHYEIVLLTPSGPPV